jgi:hypothetical protein
MKTYEEVQLYLHHFSPRYWMESDQIHALAGLPIEEPRYETVWVPEPVRALWTREKFLILTGNSTLVVQHVAHFYTD